MKLWNLRYRWRHGVKDGVIEAEDYAQAERVGKRFCERTPDLRFIGVTAFVIATPDILGDESEAAKPSQETSREPPRKSLRIGA